MTIYWLVISAALLQIAWSHFAPFMRLREARWVRSMQAGRTQLAIERIEIDRRCVDSIHPLAPTPRDADWVKAINEAIRRPMRGGSA